MPRKLRLLLRVVKHLLHHPKNFSRLLSDFYSGGLAYVAIRVRCIAQGMACMGPREYRQWYEQVEAKNAAQDDLKGPSQLDWQPRFSILMPVYNPPAEYLREAIGSVLGQHYGNWELCIVDDVSTEPHVAPLLREMAQCDQRIKLQTHKENGNLSIARNTGMKVATGDFICLLDHDDLLAPQALLRVAQELNMNPALKLLFSDEDKIDQHGTRYEPIFKPGWNPELYLGQNYVHHLVVFEADLLHSVGGYRAGYEGAEDYDCVFRASERIQPAQIHHIPEILYHWRRFTGSESWLSVQLERVENMAVKVVQEHFERTGRSAIVSKSHVPGFRQITLPVPATLPSISVIASPKAGASLILPPALDIELLIVNGEDADYTCFNKLALKAQGDVLLFLTSPIRPISDCWLESLVAHLYYGSTGAVGPKILTSDARIWSSHGVVSGDMPGRPGHRGQPADSYGFDGRLALLQRCSSLSLNLMLTKSEVFRRLGGLKNCQRYSGHLSVVDYCLQLGQVGEAVMWVPSVQVQINSSYKLAFRNESETLSGITTPQREAFQKCWGKNLRDLYFSPNLSNDGCCDFTQAQRYP